MPSNPQSYYSDVVFEKPNIPEHLFDAAVFENCIFKNFDFSDAKFADTDFIESEFENCNFSLAKLENVGMKEVMFKQCKLTGIDFGRCKDFLFCTNFKSCILDYTSFIKKKNKKSHLIDCSAKGADFTESDFSQSLLQNCDFANAVFLNTNLNGVNISTSYNFIINPETNQLKKAKFSLEGLPGLLANYGITIVS
jgi:uncharacterized protein YjbI with pentapeptide repeats